MEGLYLHLAIIVVWFRRQRLVFTCSDNGGAGKLVIGLKKRLKKNIFQITLFSKKDICGRARMVVYAR